MCANRRAPKYTRMLNPHKTQSPLYLLSSKITKVIADPQQKYPTNYQEVLISILVFI